MSRVITVQKCWKASRTIQIVFDGPPGPESGRFVEVEENGKSINFGEWRGGNGGFWYFDIPVESPAPAVSVTMEAIEDLVCSFDWAEEGQTTAGRIAEWLRSLGIIVTDKEAPNAKG